MKSLHTGMLALAVLIVIMGCAGCAEVAESAEEGGLFGAPSTPTVTTEPTATPSYMTVETPYSTQTPGPSEQPTFSKPTTSGTPGPEYFEIYHETLSFNYDVVSLGFNLVYPPMIIEVTVHPEMVEDVKEGDSSYGDKDETYVVTKQVPHDQAEVRVTVYDKETGEMVEEMGYGKAYTWMEQQTLTVYAPGNYQVELTGSYADADVIIKVPPGNIETQ